MMKKVTSGLCVAALALLAPMSAMALAYDGVFDWDALNGTGFLDHPVINGLSESANFVPGDDFQDLSSGEIEDFDAFLGAISGGALNSSIITAQAGIDDLAEFYLLEYLFNNTSAPNHADVLAKMSANFSAIDDIAAASTIGLVGFATPATKVLSALACIDKAFAAGISIGFGVSVGNAAVIYGTSAELAYMKPTGDLDGDSISNRDEWVAAQLAGKEDPPSVPFEDLDGAYQDIINEFILQAITPTTPPEEGDPVVPPLSAPVAGPLGLAILAGAVSLGGALAVRRKK